MAEQMTNDESDSEEESDNKLGPHGERCLKCGITNTRRPTIPCTLCMGKYHITCVNVKRVEARALTNYSCPTCRNATASNSEPGNDGQQTPAGFDLPKYLKTCRSNVSIINHIPRGARIAAAEALNDLINEVIRSNTPRSWAKLLCFAYHSFQKPKKEKPSPNSPSLVSKIKHQISTFKNTQSTNFPPERFPFQMRDRSVKPKPKEEILKIRVDAKFSENDLRGAIRELSSDDTLAPDDNTTLNKLKERHPAAPTGITLPPAPEDRDAHIQVSTDSVKNAILSFPAGSAGGPDGLKPGHLKHLIGASEAGNRLLESITKLVNFVLMDKIPEDIRPIFFGANLCALSKKDEGIRPIAVGTTFRRLTTKAGLKPISRDLGNHLRPNQLGYSSKGGSEAAAHAARHYLMSNTQNKVFLKLDIKNAFNTMNRDVILQKVKEHIPSLYNLIWQAYSKPSHLFYRNNILSSETGLQ